MARVAILLALLCSCGEDSAQPGAGCASNGRCSTRALECEANGQNCFCDGMWWHCRSPLCPPRDGPRGTCQAPLSCDYELEWGCACIAPENRWRCCGGVNLCPREPVEGELCCGGPPVNEVCPSPCSDGKRRVCRCEQAHSRCSEESCPDGGT